MENTKYIFMVVSVLVFLFSAGPALAGCGGPIVPCGYEGDPCEFCDLYELIDNIIIFILTCLVPIVAALMFIIGGLYLLTAGGSPETFNKAKSVITAAVIGLAVIFLAWIFLNTFFSYIGLADWNGIGVDLNKWWDIQCDYRPR